MNNSCKKTMIILCILCLSLFLFAQIGSAEGANPLPVSNVKIPSLPIMYIITETGEDPVCERVDAPEDMWGSSVINNEYIPCKIIYKNSDGNSITGEGTIRIRGNNSSWQMKKSFKLKFDNPKAIFTEEAQKTWLLLSSGSNLKNLIGNWLADYLGIDYVPKTKMINVVVNDDWRGLYYLTEPVERGSERISINDDGLIFENDAYWWNEDYYFRLVGQIPQRHHF